MLSYIQYNPSPGLTSYIECYWILHAPFMSLSSLERLVPGGRAELILNLGDPIQLSGEHDLSGGTTIRQAHVFGQRSHIYYAKKNGETHLVGVRFKPGGIGAFTKLPASLFLNQLIAAEDVLGTAVKNWEDRLWKIKNDSERINLLDRLIMKAVKGTTAGWESCKKVADTIRKSSPVFVNVLCDENESYYKKLERNFLQHVGYTPKNYYRIIRFNRALRQMHTGKKTLTAISYDCDYYDQSHFIKDFRQFTGTTPTRFKTENHTIAGFLINQQPV